MTTAFDETTFYTTVDSYSTSLPLGNSTSQASTETSQDSTQNESTQTDVSTYDSTMPPLVSSSSTRHSTTSKSPSDKHKHIVIFISIFIPFLFLVFTIVLAVYIRSYRKKMFMRTILKKKKKSIIDDTFRRFSRYDERRLSRLLDDKNTEVDYHRKSGTELSTTFELSLPHSPKRDAKSNDDKSSV